MSVLGFISKASETVDQLAVGISELSHLKALKWGLIILRVSSSTNQKAAQ
ncbi:hypothetical protein HSISB1_233 [Streptococcus sp. HSISB1]|nr:hypothetical protein HSISB1_233 [Streptococcus sp. HSISB1]